MGSFGPKASGPLQMHAGDDSMANEEVPVIAEEVDSESRQVSELLVKHVMIDCWKEIKQSDTQKSIYMDFAEA